MKSVKTLPIASFQKHSLIDYPGLVSSVIYVKGFQFKNSTNFNTRFASRDINPLVNEWTENEILQWLQSHHHSIDAVVISGGEPTLYPQLLPLIKSIKELQLKIKLDTNGSNPEVLDKLIAEKWVDYVCMDVRAPLAFLRYRNMNASHTNDALFEKVMKSIDVLKQEQVDCEFKSHFDESVSMDEFMALAGKMNGKYYIHHRTAHDKMSIKNAKVTSAHSL